MENLTFQIICILLFIVFVIFMSTIGKNNCVKQGGKVIEDVYGLFDKCVVGEIE